jgi:hypothetical protein
VTSQVKYMLRSVRSLLGRKDQSKAQSKASSDTSDARDDLDCPKPEHTTYVVGDIHGRADLLELLLGLIDAHIGGTGTTRPQLVFVGDYVDHGPESAETLARMRELTRDFGENVVCLMGNHERMMLDFLADPVTRGPRWLREGGAATLWSFRIDAEPIQATGKPRISATPQTDCTTRCPRVWWTGWQPCRSAGSPATCGLSMRAQTPPMRWTRNRPASFCGDTRSSRPSPAPMAHGSPMVIRRWSGPSTRTGASRWTQVHGERGA